MLPPLSARSVVLSALLGTHPPEMPVASLIALADRFGMSAGTVRTALSRMVAAGELDASDGRYRLRGALIERQRDQDVGRQPATTPWDGQWWVVTVLDPPRTTTGRRRLRSVMAGAKLGELRPDTWLRPTNLPVVLSAPGLLIARGALDPGGSAALTARLWDAASIQGTASELLDAVEQVAETLGGMDAFEPVDGTVIADAFTVLAAGLRFLRTEPQLPPGLLDTPAASALRTRYHDVEPRLQEALRRIYPTANRSTGTINTSDT